MDTGHDYREADYQSGNGDHPGRHGADLDTQRDRRSTCPWTMSAAGRKESSSSAHVGRGLLATSALTMILVSSSFASSGSTGSQRRRPPDASVGVCPCRRSDPAVMPDRPFLGGPQSPSAGAARTTVEGQAGKRPRHEDLGRAGQRLHRRPERRHQRDLGRSWDNSAKIDVCKGTAGRVHDTVHDVLANGLEEGLGEVRCATPRRPVVPRNGKSNSRRSCRRSTAAGRGESAS